MCNDLKISVVRTNWLLPQVYKSQINWNLSIPTLFDSLKKLSKLKPQPKKPTTSKACEKPDKMPVKVISVNGFRGH